jgi:transposase InsO family protein
MQADTGESAALAGRVAGLDRRLEELDMLAVMIFTDSGSAFSYPKLRKALRRRRQRRPPLR